MQMTTSREFVEWSVIIEDASKEFTKEDYYLAQIAAEVRRSFVQKPEGVKLKDFFLQFEQEKAVVNPKDRMGYSKAYWSALVGV